MKFEYTKKFVTLKFDELQGALLLYEIDLEEDDVTLNKQLVSKKKVDLSSKGYKKEACK